MTAVPSWSDGQLRRASVATAAAGGLGITLASIDIARSRPAVGVLAVPGAVLLSLLLAHGLTHGMRRVPFATGRHADLWMLTSVFLLIVTVGFVRAGLNGTQSWAAIASKAMVWALLPVVAAHLMPSTTEGRDRVVRGLLLSPAAYVTVNVVLFALGVRHHAPLSGGRASVLGALGLSVDRVHFPLALGVNGFGVIAGAALVTSFLVHRRTRGPLTRVLVVGSAVGLLLSDSRGGAAGLLIVVAVGVLPSFVRRLAVPTVILTGLLLPLVTGLVRDVGTSLDVIARGARTTLLSNRETIWELSVSSIRDDFGVGQLVFGNGYLGHVSTGLSAQYVPYVSSHLPVANPENAHVHNSYLQLLVDYGLVGLLVVVALLLVASDLAESLPPPESAAATAMVLYVAAVGATDLTLLPYAYLLTAPLVLVCLILARREVDEACA